MEEKKARLQTVDFLKGIAILMVIFVHSPQRVEGMNETFYKASQYFEMGCQLFFMLSGFSLSLSWDKREQTKMEFYKSRFLRIAPSYYMMIIFYFVLSWILRTFQCYIGFPQNYGLHPILNNILFLHGFLADGHNDVVPGGWYIGVAMFFYVVFPFLISGIEWFKSHVCKYIILIPFAVFLLNRFLSLYVLDGLLAKLHLNEIIYYPDLLFNIPCFILGIVLYNQYADGRLMLDHTKKRFCLLIAILLGVIAVYDYYNYMGNGGTRQFSSGLLFYMIFILVLNEEKNLGNGKICKMIMGFGKESYFIYLIHFLFVWDGMHKIFQYLYLIPGSTTIKYICVLLLMLPLIYLAGKGLSLINGRIIRLYKNLGR